MVEPGSYGVTRTTRVTHHAAQGGKTLTTAVGQAAEDTQSQVTSPYAHSASLPGHAFCTRERSPRAVVNMRHNASQRKGQLIKVVQYVTP